VRGPINLILIYYDMILYDMVKESSKACNSIISIVY